MVEIGVTGTPVRAATIAAGAAMAPRPTARTRFGTQILAPAISTRADEYGDKVVFRFLDTGAGWSYGDLVVRAERVGVALAAHGEVPGQHAGS